MYSMRCVRVWARVYLTYASVPRQMMIWKVKKYRFQYFRRKFTWAVKYSHIFVPLNLLRFLEKVSCDKSYNPKLKTLLQLFICTNCESLDETSIFWIEIMSASTSLCHRLLSKRELILMRKIHFSQFNNLKSSSKCSTHWF